MLAHTAMLVLCASAPSLPVGPSASVSFDEAGATFNLGDDERVVLAVTGFGWTDVSGTDPVAQQVLVRIPGSCSGTIRVRGPSPFGLHAWGLGEGISAGVPGGMGLDTLNDLVVLPEG